MRKFPVDSNAAAQEKGLAAVFAFVESSSPSVSAKVASEIISGIITKCLTSPKAKTKELAVDIIMMYIEIEKHELVSEELIKGLDNKTPKIVCACINILKDSLKSFGPRVIKPSPLIKFLSKGLEDRDKNVREETKQLSIELFRWMKDALKPQLSGLKPVQLTELETEFEKLSGEKATPTRFLRSEQHREAAAPTTSSADAADGIAASAPTPSDEIDPYELLEPVEIISKLPADFYTNCESKKWQERKQALEQLQGLLTPNPKLAAGDYGDLVRVLKKFIQKDTMIPVVAAAAKCLADLASKLRKAFYPFAHSCIAVILEKFKEKKQQVVVALREAIDAIMVSTTLENILEDITAALDNKNPQIKTETAAFLTRQFQSLHFSIIGNKKLLKPLIDSLIKTLSDMDAGVRDAAAEAIGTATKVVGERIMSPFLADVDSIKMTKVKEFQDKAEVKYPAPPGGHPVARTVGGSSAPAPVSRPAKSETVKHSTVTKTSAPPAKSTATIVNKPLSTKGIKSKLDSGRNTKNGTTRPGTAPSTSSLRGGSSLDDLDEQPAPLPTRSAPKGKSIIPPKSAAPRTTGIKSRTDCGLKKAVSSAPSLEKAAAGAAKSRIGSVMPKRNSIQGQIPASITRSASPLDEEDRDSYRTRGSTDGTSEDGEQYHPMNHHVAPQLSQTPRFTPMKSNGASRLATPRTETRSRLRQQQLGGSYDLPSPIVDNGMNGNIEMRLNLILSQLMSNPQAANEAFSEILSLFDNKESVCHILGSKVEQIILSCIMQYRMCLSKKLEASDNSREAKERGEVLRLFKSVTSVLEAIFKHPDLRRIPSKDTLKQLMPQVLSIIIDPKMDGLPEGEQIVRLVNVLATNIVVNADATSMLCALICQLQDCLAGNFSSFGDKFMKLVLKSLWKISRMIETIVDNLDLDEVMLHTHEFLVAFPPCYWKKEGVDDVPLRTIKTITYLIVRHVGEDILGHMSKVPNAEQSDLMRYLHRIVNDMQRNGDNGPSVPRKSGVDLEKNQSIDQGQRSAVPTPAKNGVKSQVNGNTSFFNSNESKIGKTETQELSRIFNLIGSNDPEEGFTQLLEFVETHPDFNLDSHLERTSTDFFRSYVMKGINQMKDQKQDRLNDQLQSARRKSGVISAGVENNEPNGPNSSNPATPTSNVKRLEDLFPLQSQTPKLNIRSKLATLPGNSAIPTPSASALKLKREFPRMNTVGSPQDVYDWVKQSSDFVRTDLKLENQFPPGDVLVEKIKGQVEAKSAITFTGKSEQDFEIANIMVEEAKNKLSDFKKRFNVN